MHPDGTSGWRLGWVKTLPALAWLWYGAGCEGSPAAHTLIAFLLGSQAGSGDGLEAWSLHSHQQRWQKEI